MIAGLARSIAAALVMVLLAAAPAPARDLTEAEKASLDEHLAQFDTAIQQRDWSVIIAKLPPKVIDSFAVDANMPRDQLITELTAYTVQAMGQVTFERYDVVSGPLDFRQTPSGEPYVIIPSEIVFGVADKNRFRVVSGTLGMLDAGEWYFVSVDDAAVVAKTRAAYPDFAAEEFPKGITETLE